MALPPRYSHLVGSKWTSVEPFLGWRHFHVNTLRRGTNGWEVEVAASVDKAKVAWLPAASLLDQSKWTAGWTLLTAIKAARSL